MTGCIGIMHNANSMSIGNTPPSLMLNGNCITSINSTSAGSVQRYRLDTLPTVATGCSLVATHDGIITSSAVSPASFAEVSTTAVDSNRGFSKTLAGLAAIGGKCPSLLDKSLLLLDFESTTLKIDGNRCQDNSVKRSNCVYSVFKLTQIWL